MALLVRQREADDFTRSPPNGRNQGASTKVRPISPDPFGNIDTIGRVRPNFGWAPGLERNCQNRRPT